tara:strand:+ start:142 stop:546 length:405 start_codon:yes stop_codon:yes gene_type:complete
LDWLCKQHKFYGILAEISSPEHYHKTWHRYWEIVFEALNKVEIAFVSIIIICLTIIMLKYKRLYFSYALSISIVLLILQTFWLLPALSQRATQIIQDIKVPKSNLHFLFVLFEILKIGCLTTFGIKLLNTKNMY